MEYNTQIDPRWSNDDMGLPGDRIYRWGCLVATIANIYQDKKLIEYTPKDLNEFIKLHNLYMGPTFPGSESCMKTDEVLKRLFLKKTDNVKWSGKKTGTWYYARVLLHGSGHYINVIDKVRDQFLCFDVWDGKLKYYHAVQNLYRVEAI